MPRCIYENMWMSRSFLAELKLKNNFIVQKDHNIDLKHKTDFQCHLIFYEITEFFRFRRLTGVNIISSSKLILRLGITVTD